MIRNRQRQTLHPYRRILIPLFFLLLLSSTTISAESSAPIYRQTCNSNAQCLHGGTCRYTETGQGTYLQCQCAAGYTGSRCEHDCPLACQHGGICRASDDKAIDQKNNNNNSNHNKNNKKEYTCRCMGYFTGRLCETPYENCNEGVRCYNHGKCKEIENDHHVIQRVCECPPEWTGPSCETRAVASDDHVIESSSGRTTLWVVLVLCGLLGMGWAVSQRKKWRSRRWRYNAVTRRAVSKFHDHEWLEGNNINNKHHDDDHYLDDEASNHNDLHDYSFKASKFRDAPEYKNII